MRILITGSAGFVGSNLADKFLSNGAEVTIFDNLSRRGVEKNLDWLNKKHGNVNFVKGDIRNASDIGAVMKDIDAVFHCAAQTAVTTSVKDPTEDFEINARGTFNVLEAARRSRSNPKVIYTSTNKVYGNNVNAIALQEKEKRYEFSDRKFAAGIPENFPTDASEHTPYGCSKYAGDLYMRDFFEIYGLPTVTLRMSCIYGTHQYGCEDQGWVAHFIISSIFGKPLTIYGDGKQVRDILFIDDLVGFIELAAENINRTKGQVYNIGGGVKNTISLLELLDMLKRLGIDSKYSFSGWRPADQKVYVSDISKAAALGWSPSVKPEDGIKRLALWVKENRGLFNGV